MKEEYIVAWLIREEGYVKPYQKTKDDWARFDNYEEATMLYDELLRDERLISASIAKTIKSTEL